MHTNKGKPKFSNRKPSHRNSMIRTLILELIRAEKIKSTPNRIGVIKARFDRLVTEAKKDTFASRRNVENFLRNDKAVDKFYNKILPRLSDRNSGYTVTARTLPRKGDFAEQMYIAIIGYKPYEKQSALQKVLNNRK
jgi:large subunit ribosomal protein L17